MDFYWYPSSSFTWFNFTNYTNDEFYGKNRLFRYQLIIYGQVFNLQKWKDRPWI
jgi:hypothetical protein